MENFIFCAVVIRMIMDYITGIKYQVTFLGDTKLDFWIIVKPLLAFNFIGVH